MANNSSNVRVDEEVFKLQNIIQSGSDALDSFNKNAQEALAEENLVSILHLAMENETFRKGFINAIVTQIGSSRIIRAIVTETNEDIKNAIHSRVASLLTTETLAPVVSQILSMVSNGNLPELPDVMFTERLEDLKPDSVENVRKILELLAGDKAWKS